MSRPRARKKGVQPLVAVGMLLATGSFAAWSLGGLFGPPAAPGIGRVFVADEADETAAAADTAPRWQDLLAVYGSYDGSAVVRMAFAMRVDAAASPAPLGESDAAMRWRGNDPPMLRLGVVMVSEAARRAVLDGRVVGVGDQIAGGEIIGIEAGLVQMRWQSKVLTYDLDGVVPREFRAELLLRGAAAENAAGDEDEFNEAEGDR